MEAAPIAQPIDPRPFTQLLLNCELKALASRVATVVANFFQMIAQFLVQNWRQLEQKIAMRAVVYGVPAEEKVNVVALALQLITPQMNAVDKITLIRKLGGLPADQRADIIQHALQLITPQMETADRLIIIEVLTCEAPADQRADGVEDVIRLITPLGDVWKVTRTPANQRANIIQHALLLIIPQMNVWDRIAIISELKRLPVDQRADIIQHALRLITPQMGTMDRLTILVVLTQQVPADQRADVIQHALRFITPQMNMMERMGITLQIARVPADQRVYLGLIQRPVQQYINVHADNRDQRTKEAIESLRRHQGNLSEAEIERAINAFIRYLEAAPIDAAQKGLAQKALLSPIEEEEEFGPLIGGEAFSILGLMLSGKEVIGRHWIFAEGLAEPEQTNAKKGIISALKDSYSFGKRICNQGKTQHFAVAVLQGRLAGVNIEGEPHLRIATVHAINMFFSNEPHRNIAILAELLQAANQFCDANPLVDRESFLQEVNQYVLREQIV